MHARRPVRRVLGPLLAGAALTLCALGGSGCGDDTPPRAVFLIVVDTLRPDRLSAYGCETHTTPAVDALAAPAR